MTYSIDGTQDPCAIDAKLAGSPMLGICAGRDGELRISLNDAAQGRPRNFDQEHAGIVMTLYRYQGTALSVAKADGSDLRELTAMSDLTGNMSPDWSPDGRQIAWTAWRSLYGEILPNGAHSFVIRADGSGLKSLGRGNVPRWSPDGKKIVLSRSPNTRDDQAEQQYEPPHVFVMNPDGSGAKDLGPGISPNWSPDGKQLVISRPPDSGNTTVHHFAVWVMNADGSGCQKIEELGTYPEWSPKRNEIAYIERLDNNPNLCVHDLATHQHRNLSGKQYLAFKLMALVAGRQVDLFSRRAAGWRSGTCRGSYRGRKEGAQNPLVELDLRRTEPRVLFECRLERHERGDPCQGPDARGSHPPLVRFRHKRRQAAAALAQTRALPAEALAYSPDGTRIACCGQRSSKPWASPGGTPAKLGPTVELVLGPDSALDLDTGKVSAAPKTNRFQPRRDWMRNCGADVNISDTSGGWTLRFGHGNEDCR